MRVVIAAPRKEPFLPKEEFGPGSIIAGCYEVVREIGRGAYGTVYEVRGRLPLRQRMALKVLGLDGSPANAESTMRFMREAQVLSDLKHPNLLSVFEVGAGEARAWLAMEYLEGETLADLLERERRIDPTELVDIFLPLLSALARVHARLLVHRDIKPENLFLAREETGRIVPKLLDFGIVKTPEGSTREGLILGTPQYMSPEQWTGTRSVNTRSDQFSLGVILYEALTGVRVFEGSSLREVFDKVSNAPIVPMRQRVAALPEAMDAAVLRALARKPEDRFDDVTGLARALWPFASLRAKEDWAAEFGDGSIAPPMSASAGPRPRDRVETAPELLPAAPETLSSTPLDASTGMRTFERRLKRSPGVWVWLAVMFAACGFAVLLASLLIKIR